MKPLIVQPPQAFVNQTPKFELRKPQAPRRENQVLSKAGIIRPDRRKKTRYF